MAAKTATRRARNQLSGYRGLAVAIVAQAAADLGNGDPTIRRDAAGFFESVFYRHMLELLDLDPGLRPDRCYWQPVVANSAKVEKTKQQCL